jgi:single-strand DNA-binding protein
MNYNKIIVIGRLTANPEKRKLYNGNFMTQFSVATNKSYIGKDGQKVEDVTYHSISAFGKLGESCASFLKKGQEVMVEGSINTSSWDKPDGTKGYRTEILAQNVQFGSRPRPQSTPQGEKEAVVEYDVVVDVKESLSGKNKPKATIPGPVETEINYPTEDCDPNSIPF